MASLKEPSKETMVIEDLELRDEADLRSGELVKELDDVVIDEPEQNRVLKIGVTAPEPLKALLAQFLGANTDVFAWSHEDMPGINPRVAAHHLNIDPMTKPVR